MSHVFIQQNSLQKSYLCQERVDTWIILQSVFTFCPRRWYYNNTFGNHPYNVHKCVCVVYIKRKQEVEVKDEGWWKKNQTILDLFDPILI